MLANTISLPVIDLRNFPSERSKLAAASTALGCFRVVNHGIPAALQADMKAAIRSLFGISAEAKLRNADVIAGSGYMPPSPENPLYEAFGLYNAASSSDVRAFCSLLEASPSQRCASLFPFTSSASFLISVLALYFKIKIAFFMNLFFLCLIMGFLGIGCFYHSQ